MHSSNKPHLKIDPTTLPKRNSKPTLSVKTFSPMNNSSNKEKLPLSTSHVSNSGQKISYSTQNMRSKTNINSANSKKHIDDTRKIEINLTDDINLDQGLAFIPVNNEKNIKIDNNEEEDLVGKINKSSNNNIKNNQIEFIEQPVEPNSEVTIDLDLPNNN
jgi:hypothetical protein